MHQQTKVDLLCLTVIQETLQKNVEIENFYLHKNFFLEKTKKKFL